MNNAKLHSHDNERSQINLIYLFMYLFILFVYLFIYLLFIDIVYMYVIICTFIHICVAFLVSHTLAFLFYSLPSPVTELTNSQVLNKDNFKK